MRTLLLMRHAKSSWSDSRLADFNRPLNRRGQKAAARMGRLLVAEGLVPDRIVSSSAVRCRETIERLLTEFGSDVVLDHRDELYHAAPRQYVRAVAETDDAVSRLLVLGHNPGMEELIATWSGEAIHYFPTAAIAHYELPLDRWSEIETLAAVEPLHVWRPKEQKHLEHD